ncbi:serine/threonine protein kinase [Actinoplanes friuliensis]|uniref:Putative serine/threonine protein kinase n=1 Tax=Actinoplanes friuliensis DSM 7358 TaxID=1246995 RepID=U5W3J1_9ACTN|nr:serine/threonine-protein kinase [Actinoplanes friuliensis]AGZ43694.1 putative serine/threonine protein kinase [Actinoplanes friuliensis DSM 7358]
MSDERTTPLRPRDPRKLGSYELIGRLGEGGMGTVYLARSAAGVLVAVKMVRADLAPDDAFRRRFRSEVNRVRQVPPFCTAEVLDADPDHEQPYLVVEYVDGPSLAEVVEERGPLTASNLHSVAIGVATALTAIHGAGVIHRDLKPRNVLLAPGSPKVIDFGIARAMEATSAHTQTDQMVGTVAYMAPERFASDTDTPLTPAADVFAWGGVVAYAGTGRTPFSADSPPATAARILTQPPDLTGLSGPLRDLIGHALEKDPANRPSARELLDLLVAGPQRPAASGAALDHQPGLRHAAEEAQAVTGYHAGRQLTALAAPTTLVGYSENSIVTQPVPTSPAGPTTPFLLHDPTPRRPWVLPVAVALLVIAVLAVGGMAATFWPRGGTDDPVAGPSFPPDPDPDAGLLLADPLLQRRLWQSTVDSREQASCSFDGGLIVRRETRGVFKCRGPEDAEPDDLQAEVGIRLLTADSCASIWMRFDDNRGYQVRICERNVYIGSHKSRSMTVYKTFPLDDTPIGVGAPATRITVSVVGNVLEVLRDGELVGSVPVQDKEITSGKVVLGLFTERGAPQQGPYVVSFTNIKIWPIER